MKILQSTIFLKLLMAVSGVVLVGFVVVHMVGNLQIFIPDGGETLDAYGAMLQKNAPVKWTARAILLGSVFAHIYTAVVLTLRSKAARPVDYNTHKWLGGSYAVRTMRWGGVILLLFIVYHLLHLTVGVNAEPVFSTVEHCKADYSKCYVFQNVVSAFKVWYISLFYIIAQCALGLHLTHGFWSLFRTLGFNNPRWSDKLKTAAIALGVLITTGNCSIPIAVLLGFGQGG